jgi:hypothetical protein
VIVLFNKWDDYSFELNRELLREKYGRNLVFLETDSLTGTGIAQLREKICQLAGNLPGLKAAWPAEWRLIKEELPGRKKSWLTFEDFREFCGQRGITKAKDHEALAEPSRFGVDALVSTGRGAARFWRFESAVDHQRHLRDP